MTRPTPQQLREVAKLVEESDIVEGWKDSAWATAHVQLDWDLGRSVGGYQAIRKEVERRVQDMLPQLARDAIEDIQRRSAEALKALDTNGWAK